MTKYTFEANTIRSYKSPSANDVITYTVLVKFENLPVSIPLDVNPRQPKMNTAVAKELIAAVNSSDPGFDIYNRGIVIRAKELKFNREKSEVTLDLGDDSKSYGILDGGHTYTAITQYREPNWSIEKYVKLEVLVGENLNVSAVADARNTSLQVSDIALFELDDKFNFIKEGIKNEFYKDNIAFKDNENKPILVADLLRLMFAFNIKRFPDDAQPPIQAYSGKATVFKDYKNEYDKDDNIYESLSKILPTLVKLYEKIEVEIKDKYVAYKKDAGFKNPKFGNVRGVKPTDTGTTEYTGSPIEYNVSTGYIMPIFGAFRALLKRKEDGSVEWEFDPIKMWDKYGEALVQNTFDTDTNPNQNGKNKTLWLANYRIIDSKRKDLLIDMLMKNSNWWLPFTILIELNNLDYMKIAKDYEI